MELEFRGCNANTCASPDAQSQHLHIDSASSTFTPLYPLVSLSKRATTPLTNLYFSMVTFSTLGFGDVTPCNWVGELAVMLEVFLGYVLLGGLITILAMKLVPPR